MLFRINGLQIYFPSLWLLFPFASHSIYRAFTFFNKIQFLINVFLYGLKHLPPMRETWVRSLGWEDPPEKEMVTHSSILAWRIPWTEELGGLQSTGSQSRTQLSNFTSLHFILFIRCKKVLPKPNQKDFILFKVIYLYVLLFNLCSI